MKCHEKVIINFYISEMLVTLNQRYKTTKSFISAAANSLKPDELDQLIDLSID